MTITRAELSRLASRLAWEASGWACDLLIFPEKSPTPVSRETLDRFLMAHRELLDGIERLAIGHDGVSPEPRP